VHEAKTHFLRLIDAAHAGRTISTRTPCSGGWPSLIACQSQPMPPWPIKPLVSS
jgi:hypothetical protein